MAWIVQSLNEEWATVASSPAARRALMRWTSRNPALATAHSVDDFVDTRTRPAWGNHAVGVPGCGGSEGLKIHPWGGSSRDSR
jgi:hypothetical protein